MTVSWTDLVKDAGDAGYEALPEMDYDLIVADAKFKPSKSGKKMWEIKAKVEGGAYNNRPVWDNLVVTPDNPNALAMFFRKMGALGLTPEFFKSNPSDDQVSAALRNRRFRARIGTRTWQGQKKNEIQQYFPAAESASGAAPTAQPPAASPAPAAAPPPPQAAPPAPPAAPPQAPPAPAPQPQAAAPEQPQVPQQDPWTGAPAASSQVTDPAAPPQPEPQPQPTPEPQPQPQPEPQPAPEPAPAPAPAPQPEPQQPQPAPAPQPEPQQQAQPTPPPPPAAPF